MGEYLAAKATSRILQEILDALGEPRIRLADGSWMARCPAHDDRDPSLHITPKEGRVLLHCFAGCSYQEIVNALKISSPSIGGVEDIYVYTDEAGNPLFRKIRFFPKDFIIERYENGRWEAGLGSTRRVLFNLQGVIQAKKVYIVEGEKDVKALLNAGLVATTNPNGASEKIVDEYIKPLAGKRVIIIPDNDQAGMRHARDWADKLKGLANVYILKLPSEYKDVSDFLGSRRLSDLLSIEDEAVHVGAGGPEISITSRFWTIQISDETTGVKLVSKGTKFLKNGHVSTSITAYYGSRRLPIDGIYYMSSMRSRRELAIRLEEEVPIGFWEQLLVRLHGELWKLRAGDAPMEINTNDEFEGLQWLVKPFVLESVPNIIYGPPSSMKSLIAMAIGASVIVGLPIIPGTVVYKQGPVLILDWESAFEICSSRWRKIIGKREETITYKACNLPLIDELEAIGAVIEEKRPALIIIDSLGPAAGGDLNNPETALTFYYGLKQLETPTLTIAHAPKNQPTSIYGSVFFSAIPKNIWTIKRLDSSADNLEFMIAMSQEKFTTGFLHDPIGLRVKFIENESRVTFTSFELGDLYPDLFTNLSLGKRILLVVKSSDGVTRDEIADILGISKEAIRKELFRLRKQNLIDERKGKIYIGIPF